MDTTRCNPIAIIAERRILEAMERGEFDDLPGYGKPLPDDEFANLPDEVRLCARILKSASFMDGPGLDPGMAMAVPAMLAPGPGGGREAWRSIERLGLRLRDPAPRRGRASAPAPALESPRAAKVLDSPYLGKVLAKLP
jgi:hypothetical protein